MEQKIEKKVSELVAGDRVIVEHGWNGGKYTATVSRVTKTIIFVKSMNSNGTGENEAKYQREGGRLVGGGKWDGVHIIPLESTEGRRTLEVMKENIKVAKIKKAVAAVMIREKSVDLISGLERVLAELKEGK
jgi:hypothetical protein